MSSSAITGPIFSDVRRSPSGSAAAPSWAFNESTGTGIYLVSPGVLGLSTAGVQRVVVDSAGNVGIGTASPSLFTGYTTVSVNNATNGGIYNILVNGTETARLQAFSGVFNVAAKGASTNLTFETNGAERARIDVSGRLILSAASGAGAQGKLRFGASTGFTDNSPINGYIQGYATGSDPYLIALQGGSVTQGFMGFYNSSSALQGEIKKLDNTTTQYLTTSDARLKEDLGDWSALPTLQNLKPRHFKWKIYENEAYGFFAQELHEHIPQAVGVGGEDVQQKPWSVDYSLVVPYLTKAIQEQQEIIGKLEARLAALEAK
jgi:hypothetical protein